MGRIAAWCVMALVVAACAGGPAAPTSLPTTTTTAVVSTTTTTVASTTTTAAPSTTTTVVPTTTTTVASTTTTAAPSTTTTLAIAAPTTAPTTTTTAYRTPSTTTPTLCAPMRPIGRSAMEVTIVFADVDGDPYLDKISTFRQEESWTVRVDLATGGGAVAGFGPEVGAFDPVAAIGAFDIEGDGTGELFVKVGAGAYTSLIQILDYEDCTITPITLDTIDDAGDGMTAIFPVGASIGNQSGLTCDGTMLWTFDAMLSGDGTFYEVMDIPYTLSGSVLTQGFGDGAIVDADEMTGPLFSCGDLTLP